MPQTTHLGMVYTSYVQWIGGWSIIVLPTLSLVISRYSSRKFPEYDNMIIYIYIYISSTAQGGGGSFKIGSL